MDDHSHGKCLVWILVILIIFILIAIAFYAFNDDGQGNLLAPVQVRRNVSNNNKVRFPPETVKAYVRLSGDQEVPPVKTSGKGKGHVVVDPLEKTVYYDIYAKKLSSDIDLNIGVHFHRGERGVNGPVLKDLNIEESDDCRYYRFKGKWTPKDTNQPLTQEDLDDLLSGRVYVNVHTEKYSNGEIRGQVSC